MPTEPESDPLRAIQDLGESVLAKGSLDLLKHLCAIAFGLYSQATIRLALASLPEPEEQSLCSAGEAAKRLGISVKTLSRRRSSYDFVIPNPGGFGFKVHLGRLKTHLKRTSS